jgi:hypothetical protein
VTRRLFFAELLDRALDSGLGLFGRRFRRIEELEELPLSAVLAIVPSWSPACSWRWFERALWQVPGDGEPPAQVMELTRADEEVLCACGLSQPLSERVSEAGKGAEESGSEAETLCAAFIGLVRAGVVVPTELPSL